MATVTLRYWAAAKEAAGVAEEKVEALTLADALAAGRAAVLARGATVLSGGSVARRHPESRWPPAPDGREPPAGAKTAPHAGRAERAERYGLVLARSSFLINGDPAGTRPPESVLLPDDAVIEVLPPFAGG
jgi:molybdopterin synthase sulfur carrier subunit